MKHLRNTLYAIFFFSATAPFTLSSFEINRVILATDDNPMYFHFWPLTATVWEQVTGLKPTLFLVATEEFMLEHRDIFIDQDFGDVIRIDPIRGVSTATHAQVIRLLGPAYFPEDGCITSDIEMIPLSKEYFTNTSLEYPDDFFVVFKNSAPMRYAMCYVTGKGSTFAQVFGVNSTDEIPNIVKTWSGKRYGWGTDELILTEKADAWSAKTNRLAFLGHQTHNWHRIDRGRWTYDVGKLQRGGYIDSHMIRPFSTHADALFELLFDLDIDISSIDWSYLFR